jgi:hypothetical protein
VLGQKQKQQKEKEGVDVETYIPYLRADISDVEMSLSLSFGPVNSEGREGGDELSFYSSSNWVPEMSCVCVSSNGKSGIEDGAERVGEKFNEGWKVRESAPHVRGARGAGKSTPLRGCWPGD